jgi:hypothetical protein
MMDQPSMLELVTAVRDFIEQRAMPELKGHTAFHARVAANALSIVKRELETGGPSAVAEQKRLKALLNCVAGSATASSVSTRLASPNT